ncbi:hypothetical protein ColTof4_02182 [Colletotrichum tofieldiae]|nr:hypothetical protein ColTof4_02182 [Colletotrichum tofieldiae]GKT92772.1 hypothetical protein Ct61P_10622 [Colletotrichum tofieldiae]
MGSQNLLWFGHKHAESSNRYSSRFNAFEADMIVGLYEYLVLNGSVPFDITILTFCNGQKLCIESSFRRKYGISCCCPGKRVSNLGLEAQAVVGYQGKENDIILVSITRSPEDGSEPDAGFLKDLRRAIVALSRPRRLLVVLGDKQNLLASSARSIWSEVLDRMKEPTNSYISVSCEAHRREIRIRKPDEWARFASHEGCEMRCGRKTSIHGSICGQKCHG